MADIKNQFTIFIDMDGVLCNFDKAKEQLPKEQQGRPDLHVDFSKLEPMPGAIRSVFELEQMGHDLFIGDILIDDSTYRGQTEFPGQFIHFGKNSVDWNFVLETINTLTKIPYVR
jgi:hypothetical protein